MARKDRRRFLSGVLASERLSNFRNRVAAYGGDRGTQPR